MSDLTNFPIRISPNNINESVVKREMTCFCAKKKQFYGEMSLDFMDQGTYWTFFPVGVNAGLRLLLKLDNLRLKYPYFLEKGHFSFLVNSGENFQEKNRVKWNGKVT